MERRIGGAGSTIKWVIGGLALLVGWLQWNSGFGTASYTLLAIGAVVFFLTGAIVIMASNRNQIDGIVRLKEAESRIKVAEMHQLRIDNKVIAREGTTIARRLMNEMIPYYRAKAQLEARPQEQIQVVDEYQTLEYEDDEAWTP